LPKSEEDLKLGDTKLR